jgi:hypothetical protein
METEPSRGGFLERAVRDNNTQQTQTEMRVEFSNDVPVVTVQDCDAGHVPTIGYIPRTSLPT